MRLPSGRQFLLAALPTLAGAFVLAAAQTAWTAYDMISLLHGQSGMPLGDLMRSLVSGPIGLGFLEALIVYAALLWPLAAWRLPLVLTAFGLAVLLAALFVVGGAGNGEIASLVIPAFFGIGFSALLFLRFTNWAYFKWGNRRLDQSVK